MPRLDPALVQGLADVPRDVGRRVMADRPLVAHFRAGAEELWYAAPHHVEEEDSPGFGLLRRIFARFPVAGVVVEGSAYADGEFAGERLRAATRRNERGLYEYGERGYAVKLAAERGLPAIGGEPADREIAAELLARGFGPRDVLGLGFLCYVPQWGRLGELERLGAEGLFAREMPLIRRAYGLESAPPFRYEDLRRWYEELNGEALRPERMELEPLAPLAAGRLGTQRLSYAADAVRNRAIARALGERLARHGRLLAVFGNGHLACHWRALVAAFGEPAYLGGLDAG